MRGNSPGSQASCQKVTPRRGTPTGRPVEPASDDHPLAPPDRATDLARRDTDRQQFLPPGQSVTTRKKVVSPPNANVLTFLQLS